MPHLLESVCNSGWTPVVGSNGKLQCVCRWPEMQTEPGSKQCQKDIISGVYGWQLPMEAFGVHIPVVIRRGDRRHEGH